MKFKFDTKYFFWALTAISVVVVSVLLFRTIYNRTESAAAVKAIMSILMPFNMGIIMAYILCPVLNYVEKRLLIPLLKALKIKQIRRAARVLSIIITMLFALLTVSFLVWLILPQIFDSIIGIVNNFQNYYANLNVWLSGILSNVPVAQKFISEEFYDIGNIALTWAKDTLFPQASLIIQGLTTGVLDIFNIFKNLLIGIIISVYILYAKERFAAQAKKLLYAFSSIKFANKSVEITRRAHRIFNGFIVGKIIDSAIIAVLCFLGMSVFKMPYPMLISVIVGVTNVVPFFGPFIGAVPSALLILLVDPSYFFYFIIFIIVLQQLDGNVIGPKILGDSTGLTSIWVIFAILVGGGLFGFMGMVIGVPAFAVIYSLISDFTRGKLAKKNLPTSTGEYYDLSAIEEQQAKQTAP